MWWGGGDGWQTYALHHLTMEGSIAYDITFSTLNKSYMTMGNWGRVEKSGESFIYVFGVLHHFQHRSYHDGQFRKQKKSVHTVGRGSVNSRPSISNYQLSPQGSGFKPPTSEVGGECVTVHCAAVLPLLGKKFSVNHWSWSYSFM